MDEMLARLKKVFDLNQIADAQDRQRAKLLSVILMTRGFLFLCIVPVAVFGGSAETLPGIEFAFAINFCAYFLSRSKFYRWAARVVVLEGLVVIPLMTIKFESIGAVSLMPHWLSFGTLIAGLALPWRETALSIALTAVAFIVIVLGVQPENHKLLLDDFIFSMASGLFVFQFAWLQEGSRRMLEIERAKLINSSKMSVLGEMAGGVAHEVNNPLAIISLTSEQLRRANNDGTLTKETLARKLEKISDTAERIAKIVRGLRAFSRNAEKDAFEPTSVGILIENVFTLCGERMKSSGVMLDSGDIPEIALECRSVQIEQVLLNLCSNSFDAVGPLSEKWVRIDVDERMANGIPWVRIAVTDAGGGIQPKTVEKMMEPFFTTKEVGKGTGLGLSISKGIVEDHGGSLTYDPNSKNTKFVIDLPCYHAKPGKMTA